ncbi:hypothetical protein [Pseudomonas leptonychotis]|uniref:hypothetical protein n=1 Tax=Pseudomonas leptonychotis TaxID=2448482 RepID=UPI0039EE4DDF
MHKVMLLSLLALSVSSYGADKSHRLAYSKAENVEVFVDHSEAQPWCSETLNLRFAFTGEANMASVERLLPKLGGLFGAQCPAASELSWKSLNQNGQLQAQGSASKASGWVAQIVQSAAPVAAVPAVVTEPVPSVAAVAAPAIATPVAAEPVVQTPPPASPVVEATAPVAAPVSAPAVVAAPVAASVEAESAAAAAPVVVDDFAVAGWKIPLESELLATATFLTVLQDQNGCKFRTSYKPEDTGAALSAQSVGVTCGADGFASGTGELRVQRSDGVELKRFKGSFNKGFAIADGIAELPIVAFDEQRNMFMLLSSDPVSRVHYLVRATHSSYSGTWNMSSLLVVALTENVDLFRQIESIRTTLFAPMGKLEKLRPRENFVQMYAMRDLTKGLQGERDSWLYEVRLQRGYRNKLWDFSPNNANNHLFNFERKQAQIAQREAEQKAREEQRQREQLGYQAKEQLRVFQAMQEQSRNPKQLMASLVDDVSLGNGYRALVHGKSADIRQIVHISGRDDNGWALDYPYEAVLTADEAESEPDTGWYVIAGKASLDMSKRDPLDLPLTQIAATSLLACEEDGCSDFRDPLKLTRQRLNDAQWTPEDAKNQVRAAWPDDNQQAQE